MEGSGQGRTGEPRDGGGIHLKWNTQALLEHQSFVGLDTVSESLQGRVASDDQVRADFKQIPGPAIMQANGSPTKPSRTFKKRDRLALICKNRRHRAAGDAAADNQYAFRHNNEGKYRDTHHARTAMATFCQVGMVIRLSKTEKSSFAI